MLSWSAKNKLVYISITLFILLLVVGIPAYFKFVDKAPTCFDGLLNQDEKAVDCGGVCVRLCQGEATEPLVLFERYFKVAPGVYSALVLIENNNIGLYALRVPYELKLYDKDNALVAERIGELNMTGPKTFPVIEYSIPTGEREVAKVSFRILGEIDWKRGTFKDPKVEVFNKLLRDEKSTPKLTATLRNSEVYKVEDIPVVALLYDKSDNLMASSHTLVDGIAGKGETGVVFTWNIPFVESPAKIDILPMLIPRELAD